MHALSLYMIQVGDALSLYMMQVGDRRNRSCFLVFRDRSIYSVWKGVLKNPKNPPIRHW